MREMFILLAILFSFTTTAHAGVSVGYMQDVTHAEGTPTIAVEVDLKPFAVYGMGWKSRQYDDNYAVGGEYRLDFGGVSYVGAGLAYLVNQTPLNGTNLNFSVTVGIAGSHIPLIRSTLLRKCDAVYRHFSHGRSFGIKENLDNLGWNFLGGLCTF
jgi:hypothetical protein